MKSERKADNYSKKLAEKRAEKWTFLWEASLYTGGNRLRMRERKHWVTPQKLGPQGWGQGGYRKSWTGGDSTSPAVMRQEKEEKMGVMRGGRGGGGLAT